MQATPAKASHTPGPWHRNIKPASKYPIIFAGRNTHVVTAIPARNIDPETAEANHDLICAAPDMLAALHTALTYLGDDITDDSPEARACRAVIYAAIAQATGEGR